MLAASRDLYAVDSHDILADPNFDRALALLLWMPSKEYSPKGNLREALESLLSVDPDSLDGFFKTDPLNWYVRDNGYCLTKRKRTFLVDTLV